MLYNNCIYIWANLNIYFSSIFILFFQLDVSLLKTKQNL